MKINKFGFTLMEIMVVIVVIAVLASVAGPMIGSITDQGRASATKSKMSALKTGLLAYQADVGKLPYLGKRMKNSLAYCQDILLASGTDDNVLASGTSIENISVTQYKRKWKGPYMESDPSDFMFDSWGTEMKYIAIHGMTNLYLWSAGPDLTFGNGDTADNFKKILNGDAAENSSSDGGDDIVLSVAKIRGTFSNL